eukprot:1385993-Heterocapsa_arctica.AAC.1
MATVSEIMEVAPETVLAVVASAVDVAIARVEATPTPVPKIHKQTPAEKLNDVLETLKGMNLDHKMIKVAKTQQ